MTRLRILVLVFVFAFSHKLRAVEVVDLKDGRSGTLSYPSSVERISLEAELTFPESSAARVPAIVIAHGSGGLDWRSKRWARFFQTQGVATMVIDYFGPRGIYHNSSSQPMPLRDAMDALNLLATHPRIDPKRIAIIGFSRGGHLAYESANNMAPGGGPAYAAHVALYPSCGMLGVSKMGLTAPVLILVGSLDELVPAAQCEILAERAADRGSKITVKVYEGGHHGWDGDWSGDFNHRALKVTYRIQADTGITTRSERDVMTFLRPLLGIPESTESR